jgi:hypothetical protein
MEMDQLSEKAKAVIRKIGKCLLFANESRTFGDGDEDGPTEIYYKLLLIADGGFIPFKFTREVFYKHGDTNANVDYEPEELYQEDRDMLEAIHLDMYSNDYTEEEIAWESKDHVYNIDPSYLTKPGKKMLQKFQAGLEETDNIIFIGETSVSSFGGKSKSVEHFFSLFIFVRKADGRVIHHKFFRDFFDNGDEYTNSTPYEEENVFSDIDFQVHRFHL